MKHLKIVATAIVLLMTSPARSDQILSIFVCASTATDPCTAANAKSTFDQHASKMACEKVAGLIDLAAKVKRQYGYQESPGDKYAFSCSEAATTPAPSLFMGPGSQVDTNSGLNGGASTPTVGPQ